MEIKTKFNVGDTVYVFRRDSIFVTQIKDIKIYCYKDSYSVDYSIFDKDYTSGVTVSEDVLFDNEEGCRRSIPVKKNN